MIAPADHNRYFGALLLAHETLAALTPLPSDAGDDIRRAYAGARYCVNALVAALSRPTVTAVEGGFVATVPGMDWVRVEGSVLEDVTAEAQRQAQEGLGGRV